LEPIAGKVFLVHDIRSEHPIECCEGQMVQHLMEGHLGHNLLELVGMELTL